ncbi:MAG: hypothetical protein EP330_13755 [Deltaproteobacteria bacterium]|nr:MAG: hypothetical protein EP330_13755 [Deltaproteobacteria bacterium]
MDALWTAIDRGWPVMAPADVFEERVGPATIGVLRDLGLLAAEPLADGALYPSLCAERHVVRYGGEAIAVCHCDELCDDLVIARPERWRLDGWRLVERLREVLELSGPFERPAHRSPTLVGSRSFGTVTVLFAFVPRARCLEPLRVDAWLRGRSEHVVLMTPELPEVGSPALRGVEWLRLRGHVDLDSGVVAMDALARCLPEAARSAMASGVVLDHERQSVEILGVVHDLSRHASVFALLAALPPGEWVGRDALLVELNPGAITPSGTWKVGLDKLEGRLRGAVHRGRKLLGDHIEITSITVEGEVGYRLDLRHTKPGWGARKGEP